MARTGLLHWKSNAYYIQMILIQTDWVIIISAACGQAMNILLIGLISTACMKTLSTQLNMISIFPI